MPPRAPSASRIPAWLSGLGLFLLAVLPPRLALASVPSLHTPATRIEESAPTRLPSAIEEIEQRAAEQAQCGAFCGEPLRLGLRVGHSRQNPLLDTQDAWGVFRNPGASDGPFASKNRFAFTGYVFDRETELYFAKARFYDPTVGRFTSQDSFLGDIDAPPSLHRYFYGHANPLRYIDPTGHAGVEANQTLTPEEVAASLARDLAAAKARREARENATIKEPDTDHGIIGNAIYGAARWLAETRVGRKLAAGKERFDEFASQVGAVTDHAVRNAFVHQGTAEEQAVQDFKTAQAGGSTDPRFNAHLRHREDTFQGTVEVGGEIAGKGAEIAVQEGAPLAVAAAVSRVGRLAGALEEAAPSRGVGQHGVNLLEPKQLQPEPDGVRFGPPRGGGGSAADRAYAARVSGGAEKSIYVNGTEFDAVRGGTLIEAKRASGSGSFYDISGADRFTQNVKIPEILAQAKRQVGAVQGQSFRGIRWEVADPAVAQQLQTLFTQRGIRIQVVHTPAK